MKTEIGESEMKRVKSRYRRERVTEQTKFEIERLYDNRSKLVNE